MLEIELIRAKHRERCFAMEQRKRNDLALGAFLRLMLGWRKDLPDVERKRIAAEAAEMMDTAEGPFAEVITEVQKARMPFAAIEKAAVKEMEGLAKQLPVWEVFGESVRGFGAASLAVIVAEAGDLGDYSTEAKLWKRMGLAPGQGRVPKGLSRENRAEAWIARGYSPRRRSRMWNIGDSLIKGNRDGKYRTIYLARKAYEHARDHEMSDMHAHRRAQHYMEKRLLRDLWRAWRRANTPLSTRTIGTVPDAHLHQEAAE